MTRGIYAEPEDTVLTTRALEYLAIGPADVVDLIGHICSLPRAPRIVAEHMAHAMFAGRREFARQPDGRWMLSGLVAAGYGAPRQNSPSLKSQSANGSDRLCNLSYVVVDTETTGGRAFLGDRITEIAAVVVRNGEIVEVFETLVNPQRPIPPFVSRLTNITWSMVKDAPTFDRIAPEVMRVLEGNVFVAHNAGFDWRFVTQELSRGAGHRLRGRKLCTVKLARKVLPQLSRRSLDHIARYYGVEITRRHRAGGDALATAKCLIRMMRDLSDRGCQTWDELEFLMGRSSGKRRKRRAPALPHSVTKDTTA
ncbi:MAG TPA: exonuclease domain-containing protein [Gemmatimonadaceae bacterium]|nr:exonuclease domain-containing protein [Gemmatimonadaceae bacterium]